MAERDLDALLRRMAATKVNRRGFLAAAGLTGGSSGAGRVRSPERWRDHGAIDGRLGGALDGRERSTARRRSRSELFVYNWSDYIAPDEHRGVQGRVRRPELRLRRLRQQRGADRQAPGRRVRVRHRGPDGRIRSGHGRGRVPDRSSTSPGSRTSQHINETFKGLWWDPTNEYQVPKDYGTTGILWRKSLLSAVPTSWQEFSTWSRARRRARRSSSTRWATCSSSRSRCLGTRSTRSTRPSSRRLARSCSTSRRTSSPSTPTPTATRWPTARRR